MNKIDPTKKHFTRDGREVSGLRLQENGKYLSGGVDGNYRVWNFSGEHVCNADLDLVPATEPEGDAVILARARSLITEAMTLCDDRGFNIQSLIHEITSAGKNNASHKAMIEEGIRIGRREAMAELRRNTEFCESLEQYRRAVNITLKRFGEIGHDQ